MGFGLVSSRRPGALPLVAGLLGVCLLAAPGLDRQDEAIDFDRARQLRQRFLRGESLSPEERDYLERAKAAFQRRPGGPGQFVGRESTGLTPLTDLAGAARYKGQEGGL